jgi:hypothetical protein
MTAHSSNRGGEVIERIEDVPPGIDAVRDVGKISREDYDAVVVPLVEAATREGRRLRILCEVGPEFHGLTPGAAWEDVKIGLRALRMIDGCAVVSDIRWIREASRFASFLMPCPVRVFAGDDRGGAVAWLGSLPEGPGIAYRLDPDTGVVVVEVSGALRAADFEAMARTVDGWLTDHAELRGLVVHARAFPGWENLASMLRHVRFVRDHHQRIGKAALAVDGRMATLVPAVAGHFVKAEVRRFGYDELDAAVRWAAG